MAAPMEFRKALAKYYHMWLKSCYDSVEFCEGRGDTAMAQNYREDAAKYEKFIAKHKEAIEFFSKGDNAFLIESAIPERFRNYK